MCSSDLSNPPLPVTVAVRPTVPRIVAGSGLPASVTAVIATPTDTPILTLAVLVGSCTDVATTAIVPGPVGVRIRLLPVPDKVPGPVAENVTFVVPAPVTTTPAVSVAVCNVVIVYLSEISVIEVTTGTGMVEPKVTLAVLVGSATLVAVTTIAPGPVATTVRVEPEPDMVPGPVTVNVTAGLNAPVPVILAVKKAEPPTSSAGTSLVNVSAETVGTVTVIGIVAVAVGSSVLMATIVALPTPPGAV